MSPSRRYCKPVLGRVLLAGNPRLRREFIDVCVRGDGSVAYVLNEWAEGERPVVVAEANVVAVEPFGRARC